MAQFTDSSPVEAYNLSGNAFVDGLLQGSSAFRYAWSTESGGKTQITYSLPFTDLATAQFVSGYGSEAEGETLFGLDANQASLLELAFSKWEEVADLNFTKLTETEAGQVGDIRVAFSSDVNPWWGWAKLSSSGYNNAHGDIWISTDVASDDWHEGSYALNALVHEIGHALGLDHPFEGTIIPDGYDNRRYTLMSYTDPDTYWWWNPDTQRYDYLITGPMVYDIQAIQYLYGANMEFHAGNDTYSFATDIPFYKAIWDAGGKDMIDLSNFTNGNTLNLDPGSYSTLGFDNLDLTDNLGIAFGAFIENAKGGSGDDRITGNLRANILYGNDGADQLYGMSGRDVLLGGNGADRLFGGSGSDTLIGGGGDDALAGGVGNDTAKYLDASAGVMVDLQAGTASSRSAGDAAGIGNDTLTAIEYVKGSNHDDLLSGDGLANRLWGFDGNDELTGGGRSDLLDGGNGNDILQGGGGHDVLIGGAGDDLLDGGVGRDKANYKTASDGVVVNLSTGKAVSAVSGDTARIGSDTLVAIENVNGSAYADRLTGDAQANTLNGSGGKDTLIGLAGGDRLIGGAGNDQIYGGSGKDVITGGTGADRFIFDDADFAGMTDNTSDRITDFSRVQGDRISLALVDANTNTATDDAFTFIGTSAFGGQAGQLRYEQIAGNTYAQGDTNGDGTADFWIRLDGTKALAAGDFIL